MWGWVEYRQLPVVRVSIHCVIVWLAGLHGGLERVEWLRQREEAVFLDVPLQRL